MNKSHNHVELGTVSVVHVYKQDVLGDLNWGYLKILSTSYILEKEEILFESITTRSQRSQILAFLGDKCPLIWITLFLYIIKVYSKLINSEI